MSHSFRSGATAFSVALFLVSIGGARSQSPSPTAARKLKASSSPVNQLAPFKDRLANAKSVRVISPVLGLDLGMETERAHHLLDKLSDPAHPLKEEGGREEEDKNAESGEQHKILWQLTATDYSAIFIKADEHDRIISIEALLRPGKEIAFDKIGETKKAPLQDASTVAWDVIRPNRPLFRVVARGAERKANAITWFVVPRAAIDLSPAK